MSIIYALIAREQAGVLVEHSHATGNFRQVTHQLLPKLQKNTRKALRYEQGTQTYFFNYIEQDGFTYLCLSEKESAGAFRLLQELMADFTHRYSPQERQSLIAYAANSAMSASIGAKVQAFNKESQEISDPDQMALLKKNLSQAKDVMVENIDKILEREQKVDILVKKTTSMNFKAQTVKGQAMSVRRKMYWQNIRMKLVMVVVVLAILYLCVAMMCGGLTLPTC